MAKKDVLLGGGSGQKGQTRTRGEVVKKSGFRWGGLSGWPLIEKQILIKINTYGMF